jgi:hypothetical protein
MKLQSDDDCECSKNNIIKDSICFILIMIYGALLYPFAIIHMIFWLIPIIGEPFLEALTKIFIVIIGPIALLYDIFDCPPIGYPPYHSYTYL